MSKLSVSKPEKFEDVDKWIVYILDENNCYTGVHGMGNTPQEAQRGEGEIKD
jgi:hypothetical protein